MEHRHSHRNTLTKFQNFFGFGWKAASASENKLFSAENLADFAAAFPAVPLGDVFLADRAQLVAHLSSVFRPCVPGLNFERFFFFFSLFKNKNRDSLAIAFSPKDGTRGICCRGDARGATISQKGLFFQILDL
jgi:hypothetical protein